ncbi:HORMA domain-containing protein 1 [Podochytrium sp. JEL0797]|nr:HORMA domain-containing protein 1 [Podochytrium sp. JEL0797]
MITLLLFASAREHADNAASLFFSANEIARPHGAALTVAHVTAHAALLHPRLTALLPSCMFALNEDYCDPSDKVKDKDEVAIIPPKPKLATVPTQNESLQLIQNILRSSVATIAYVRNIFDDSEFEDVSFNGMTLKRFKKGNPEIDELAESLERGCFDALEKQYLKSIVFGVYSNAQDPSTLIESYEFLFTYPKGGHFEMVIDSTSGQFKKEKFQTKTKKDSARAMTTMMRRILVMTSALQPIPEFPQVALKIFYYDNVTPHDYEPPNFRKAQPEDYDPEHLATEEFGLGEVDANYHAMAVRIHTMVPFPGDEPDEEEDDDDEIVYDSQQDYQPNDRTNHHDMTTLSQTPLFRDHRCNDGNMMAGAAPRGGGGGDGMGVNPLSQISNLTEVLAVMQTEQTPQTRAATCSSPDALFRSSSLSSTSSGSEMDPPHHDDPEFRPNAKAGPAAPRASEVVQQQQAAFVRRSMRHRMKSQEDSETVAAGSGGGGVAISDEYVGCPCGSQIIDCTMLICLSCTSLNHPTCFGFSSEKDLRLPADGFRCYACVNEMHRDLDAGGDGLAYDLEYSANVAIIRRGLGIVAGEGGVVSIAAFAERMGVTLPVAKQVMTVLTDPKYQLLQPVGSKKRGGGAGAGSKKGFTYLFPASKRRSPEYAFWMSQDSLPMRPFARVAVAPVSPMQEVEEEEEECESQEILGRRIVSSGVYSRSGGGGGVGGGKDVSRVASSSFAFSKPGGGVVTPGEYHSDSENSGFTQPSQKPHPVSPSKPTSNNSRNVPGNPSVGWKRRMSGGTEDEDLLDPDMTQDEGLTMMKMSQSGRAGGGGGGGGESSGSSAGGCVSPSVTKRAKMSVAVKRKLQSQEF